MEEVSVFKHYIVSNISLTAFQMASAQIRTLAAMMSLFVYPNIFSLNPFV